MNRTTANDNLTLITALTGSNALTITSKSSTDLSMFAKLLTVIPVEQAIGAPPIALVCRVAVPPTPAAEYFCDMIRGAALPMAKRNSNEPGCLICTRRRGMLARHS